MAARRGPVEAPVPTAMLACAITVPMRVAPALRVALLPILHQTLQVDWSAREFINTTDASVAMVKVEPTWNIHAASARPSASRYAVPVIWTKVSLAYTPGAIVWPPRSPLMVAYGVRLAASVMAAVKSFFAVRETPAASETKLVPLRIPGGKPVTADPGLRARSPYRTVAPELVMVEAASTAYLLSEYISTNVGLGKETDVSTELTDWKTTDRNEEVASRAAACWISAASEPELTLVASLALSAANSPAESAPNEGSSVMDETTVCSTSTVPPLAVDEADTTVTSEASTPMALATHCCSTATSAEERTSSDRDRRPEELP